MRRKVILLTKQDRFSRCAREIAQGALGDSVTTFSGQVGDREPTGLETDAPEYLISFLSPWIVRKPVLDRCQHAINFHPGSVEYPGTGCYNFALYEEATEYGAVCHHMLPKVDTGRIILERRFPIDTHDTVETLKLRTMETLIRMFEEIVALVAVRRTLPVADTHWTRRPFTRRQLEALKAIQSSTAPGEIARRVRATVYPGFPGPYLIKPDGSTFSFPVPNRSALA